MIDSALCLAQTPKCQLPFLLSHLSTLNRSFLHHPLPAPSWPSSNNNIYNTERPPPRVWPRVYKQTTTTITRPATTITMRQTKRQAGAAAAASGGSPDNGNNMEYQSHFIHLSYSRVKAYLLLPSHVRATEYISVQHVFVSKQDYRCFGEPFYNNWYFT
jgi:hypothetical protein